MRATDRLQELMDCYYGMVPVVPGGEGVFLYQGKRVEGKRTLADYKMKNGDQIDLCSEMKPNMFVTLQVKDPLRAQTLHLVRTMRRTDRLKDLLDFCCAILDVPAIRGRFAFRGKQITVEETPKRLPMEGLGYR
ncbi:uncharacterized protein LOC112881294 [Panicum hallii]|nr:uncharacterized protein LOC112881294 [Panicum hallii]